MSDAPDTAGSLKRDHPFRPRTERGEADYVEPPRKQIGPNPFLCADCGLAEAAHAEVIENLRPPERAGGTTQTAVDP